MARSTHRPLVVAFDLEMNQPSGRIIQIGAVAGNIDSGEVVAAFSELVNPGEPLAASIATLTGIAASALPQAALLPDVFGRFVAWLAPLRHGRKLHPLTWGVWDFRVLREQVGAHTAGWPFGQRWIDVKAVYQAWRHAHGFTGMAGLGAAVEHLGLEFSGRAHDAAADAENTFHAYVALLARMRGEPRPAE